MRPIERANARLVIMYDLKGDFNEIRPEIILSKVGKERAAYPTNWIKVRKIDSLKW